MNFEKLSNILGADIIKKAYEDVVSPSAKQVGLIGEDLVKALRLVTAPFQLLASYQDRLTKYLNAVQSSIPEENQIEAPASLAGPILEKFKYLDENNYLTEVYLSLLQKAINKETISKAHPAFFHVIEQLSADEVVILHHLKSTRINYNYEQDILGRSTLGIKWGPAKITLNSFPVDLLLDDSYFIMHIEHLKFLGLLKWKNVKTEGIFPTDVHINQIGTKYESIIMLSEFGKLFVEACIGNKILIL